LTDVVTKISRVAHKCCLYLTLIEIAYVLTNCNNYIFYWIVSSWLVGRWCLGHWHVHCGTGYMVHLVPVDTSVKSFQ